MARITHVFQPQEDETSMEIGRRQLRVTAGDNLRMIIDLTGRGLAIDCPPLRGRQLEAFTRKFNLLSNEELRESLEIDNATFVSILNQCVQCVGCRRRVERLFNQLSVSGHATLDPLVLKNTSTLTIAEERLTTPQSVGTLLYRHHDILNNLLENKLRNKTRCVMHSLDAFRTRPFSETWREAWSSMKNSCRYQLAWIETTELHAVLENYLRKHKFCQGCRLKIEKAYKLLVEDAPNKEKGFVASLYANFKKCHAEEHIHILTNKIDFLDALIKRAEPEVNGSYSKIRERHAKTLEIAQEEVLTCVGMILYERLRRVYVSLREEERACQVLAAVGVHALCRSFDMAVEKKQGISNLELLYQEISRAEKAKELKREQKKLKKKMKKNEKKNNHRSLCSNEDDNVSEAAEADIDEEEQDDEAIDVHYAEDYAHDEPEGEDVEHEDDLEPVQLEVLMAARQTENKSNKKKKTQKLKKKQKKQKAAQKDKASHQPKREDIKKDSRVLKEPSDYSSSISSTSTSTPTPTESLSNGACDNCLETASNCPCESEDKDASSIENNCIDYIETNSEWPCELNVVKNSRSLVSAKCDDCLETNSHCPCENDGKDCGYGSDPTTTNELSCMSSVGSSPEGSEVSCLDVFCNHEHCFSLLIDHRDELDEPQSPQIHFENEECCDSIWYKELSLQQMLDVFDEYNDYDENCYIPQEVVLEYKFHHEKVQKQRQQLRENLKRNFARLCNESKKKKRVNHF